MVNNLNTVHVVIEAPLRDIKGVFKTRTDAIAYIKYLTQNESILRHNLYVEMWEVE